MAVVLLTGCSSGFGLEGALAFARNGDVVYATMRNLAKADALREAIRREKLTVHTKALDVTKPETFSGFVQEVVDEAGQIDVLINNAGVVRPGAFEDLPEAEMRLTMETNFFGPVLLTRAVLPHMRQQMGGFIIVVSSLSGLAGLSCDAAYAASKFAVEGAFEAMRHEVDRWGIKVALIEAGLFATNILGDKKKETGLPAYYPEDSPYRPLIGSHLDGVRQRISDAADPRLIGELFVRIAQSDGTRLRWPADDLSAEITAKLHGLDDSDRDELLRKAAGRDWWSRGKKSP